MKSDEMAVNAEKLTSKGQWLTRRAVQKPHSRGCKMAKMMSGPTELPAGSPGSCPSLFPDD
jgi:hypothetical protein